MVTELLVVARGVHFAAVVLAAGVAFFRFFIAEPAFRAAPAGDLRALEALRARWIRTSWIALLVAFVSAAIWFVLRSADIYGQSVVDVCIHGGVWTVAADTRFGQIWCARLVLMVVLGLLTVMRLPPQRGLRNFLAVILAAALLASLAWVGHAGATPGTDGDIHLTSDVFHLLAAGAWVGGLVPLVMLLVCARAAEGQILDTILPDAVSRFSFLGIASVAALLMSGIINARYLVGTIQNLVTTDYGRIVLLKITLFIAMVSLAAVNKFYLTPRLAKARATRQLQRNSLIETAFGCTALLLAGLLGTLPPSAHELAHAAYGPVPSNAAFVHIHSAEGMADVTVTPGYTGTSHATIRLWHEDLTEMPARAVTFSMTAPSPGSKPITHPAKQLADGSWEVGEIHLPQAGNWTVMVDAQLSPDSRLRLDAPIVIEPSQPAKIR